MARPASIGKRKIVAIADRGYYSAPQIKECHDVDIDAILPKPMTSNAKAEGRFDKSDFIYIARDDEYQCPARERAIYRHTTEERGLQIRRYWSSACPNCPRKAQCTPSNYRRIARWVHEAVLTAGQERLDRRPDAMRVRRRTVHVQAHFGAHVSDKAQMATSSLIGSRKDVIWRRLANSPTESGPSSGSYAAPVLSALTGVGPSPIRFLPSLSLCMGRSWPVWTTAGGAAALALSPEWLPV